MSHVHSHAPMTANPTAVLISADGRALPLRAMALSGRARAGIARITLEQTFVNDREVPLDVSYALPLPADAAVSGFSFQLDDRLVQGTIDRLQDARERFEQAILEGRSAAMVEQDTDSVFRQRVGNVPPGATIVVKIELDQRLAWCERGHAGGWEWRFPTVIAPRYRSAQDGPAQDGPAPHGPLPVSSAPRPIDLRLALHVADDTVGAPSSPSHALSVVRDVVSLKDSAALDRDIVVRWPVATPQVGMHVDVGCIEAGQDTYALVTLTPPAQPSTSSVPRDLIVLLDTSGSMRGEPLDHARRITSALVAGLGPDDTLELIEFSRTPRRYSPGPVRVDDPERQRIAGWLASLRAEGGTEMLSGVLEALRHVRDDAQRQVVLISDGHIGAESRVIAAIAEHCGASCRLHAVGIGSAVNRTLTAGAARAGRGTETVVAPGEDVESTVTQLLRATERPIVVDLAVSGNVLDHAPHHLPDLYAGRPCTLALALPPEGGLVEFHGRTNRGSWHVSQNVRPPRTEQANRAVDALFAREQVADLELHRTIASNVENIDAQIEALGLRHCIATRKTSWIAISEQVDVDTDAPVRRSTIPHELPHGMSAEGIGLRGAAPTPRSRPRRSQKKRAASPSVDRLDEETAMLPPLQRAAESAAPRPKPAPAPGGAPPPPSPRKPAPPPASAAPRPQKAESAEGSDDADDFSVAPSLAMPPWATPDFASTGVIRIGIAASSPAEVQALKEALERLLGAHVSLEVISSRVGSLQIADVHAAAKARGWCICLGTPLSQAVRDEAADFGVWCAEFPTMAAVTTFAQQLAAMLATKAGT